MSHSTLKKLALWGALSLGGMSQTAFAQWMPFGGGCGCAIPEVPPTICGPTCGIACAPPPVVCAPPQPQYVMQPRTEVRTVEQIVQKPVYETRYINVPETHYRTEYEQRTAQVPTCTYQNVTEMQTRTRDCGRWVTNYRCRPYVAPCEYDNRPGLFGFLNRGLYQARMTVTPAVIAERTYVPNVITEQVPVTRQVAVPGVRQVSYQVPRTVAYTTNRQVAVQNVRMVAERVPQQIHVTTMHLVPVNGTGMAYGMTPGMGTAGLPGYAPTMASPDPISGGLRTAGRPDDMTPPNPIPPRSPRARGPATEGADTITPAPPSPNPPAGASRVVPPRDLSAGGEEEEFAQFQKPIPHTTAYRPIATPVQSSTSAPSIVRVSQWNSRPQFSGANTNVAVAARSKTTR